MWWCPNPFIYWCFGVFYLFYGRRTTSTAPFKEGMAVSSNGRTYEKYKWNPLLNVGVSGKFDDTHVVIRDCCRIEDKFHALYAGHDGSKW